MKIKQVLSMGVMLMLSLNFVGCVSSAGNAKLENMTASTLASQLKRGRSTKADVITVLGEPMSRSADGSGEHWSYAYSKASMNSALAYVPIVGLFANGVNSNTNYVEVEFDQRGILKDYTVGQSHMNTGTHLN